jgi:DNA sulfur modification protein DndC
MGVRDNRRMRASADEWKVRPGGRLYALMERQAADAGAREVVTVLGTRRSENPSRAGAMVERRESAEQAVPNKSGALTLSPIADWDTDDVWTMLALLAEPQHVRLPTPLVPETIHRLSEIYRAGNARE